MRKVLLIALTFILCSLLACKSDYDKLVKNESKKDVVLDDLILGMKTGQTKKEFFDRCWNLNKQAIVSQGPGNKYAKYYVLPDSATSEELDKLQVLFYGMFDEDDLMYGMEMKMQYTAWSPWNKKYSSDTLLSFMKEKYMNQFGGNDYLEIEVTDEISAFTKVDGSRQILLHKVSAKEIMVKIEDLSDQYKTKNK